MFTRNKVAWRAFAGCALLTGVAAVIVSLSYGLVDPPESSGPWLYHYQTMVSGILALGGGVLAYLAVRFQVQEQKRGNFITANKDIVMVLDQLRANLSRIEKLIKSERDETEEILTLFSHESIPLKDALRTGNGYFMYADLTTCYSIMSMQRESQGRSHPEVLAARDHILQKIDMLQHWAELVERALRKGVDAEELMSLDFDGIERLARTT